MDGTREERLYHCQNWRGDVVKLISATGGGQQVEGARYSSYGVPLGLPFGDTDGDGDSDATDENFVSTRSGDPGQYDIRGDLDLDGDIDFADESLFFSSGYGPTLGFGNLSNLESRKGYAGYEHDGKLDTLAHVRNRVLATEEGRWTRRDPLDYVDGASLYGYVRNMPTTRVDPAGLRSCGGDPNCDADPRGEFVAAVEPGPGGGGVPIPVGAPPEQPRPQQLCAGPEPRDNQFTPTPDGCKTPATPNLENGPAGAPNLFKECCNKHDVCIRSCNCKMNDCNAIFVGCMEMMCETAFLFSPVLREACIRDSHEIARGVFQTVAIQWALGQTAACLPGAAGPITLGPGGPGQIVNHDPATQADSAEAIGL